MPIRKFRDISEMPDATWHEPGSPELFRAIREVWAFADKVLQPHFPPGVYKHRSWEDLLAQEEEWAKANFERYQARLKAEREKRDSSG